MSKIYDFLKSKIGDSLSHDSSRFGAWLNGKLIDLQPESVIIEFAVRKDMTNLLNILHGGVIAAIIDDSIGMTIAMQEDEKYYVSVNLCVDFLSGAEIGDILIATTKINRKGNTIVNAECAVTNKANHVIAKGTANLMQIKPKT